MALSIVRLATAEPAPRPALLVQRLLLFIGAAVRPDVDTAARLQRSGARPVCVGNLTDALHAASQVVFDAAVVDALLLQPPEQTWVARLRHTLNCPLLVIAEHADEVDEIVALEQGADDYLVRPLSSRRLCARLTALARPAAALQATATPAAAAPAPAGWRLDLATRRLCNGSRTVELSDMLAALLERLLGNAGRVVSREQLLHGLRGQGSNTDTRGVLTYVHRLRRVLRAHGVTDLQIESVAGRGYLLRCG